MNELPKGPIELLEEEIADLKGRYIRLAEDMEDLRQRRDQQIADMKKYAISEFARDLINIRDLGENILHVLARHEVVEIGNEGEKFDPNIHQAVQQIVVEGVEKNTVLEVYQKGFMLADRVLRPAVVAVAK